MRATMVTNLIIDCAPKYFDAHFHHWLSRTTASAPDQTRKPLANGGHAALGYGRRESWESPDFVLPLLYYAPVPPVGVPADQRPYVFEWGVLETPDWDQIRRRPGITGSPTPLGSGVRLTLQLCKPPAGLQDVIPAEIFAHYLKELVALIKADWPSCEQAADDASKVMSPQSGGVKSMAGNTVEVIQRDYIALVHTYRGEGRHRPSQQEMADHYHVSPATFRRHLKGIGMAWPPPLISEIGQEVEAN